MEGGLGKGIEVVIEARNLEGYFLGWVDCGGLNDESVGRVNLKYGEAGVFLFVIIKHHVSRGVMEVFYGGGGDFGGFHGGG